MVCAFDNFALELRRSSGSQLIYKHAISTIAPVRAPEEFGLPADEHRGEGLQEPFLAKAATSGSAMSLYLVNGVMLEGEVAGFDQYCVLMTRSGVPQMVYKHAISTLQSAEPNSARASAVHEEANA